MTDADFLEEIVANPDDDAPRLIYADWLEERGDPRAEFIRVQCELADLSIPEHFGYASEDWSSRRARDPRNATRFQQLCHREQQLLGQHIQNWVAPLGREIAGLRFERGFVKMLQTPATNFIKMAENWYRDTPLRNVRLDYVDGRNAPPLFKLPELRHLHTLNLHLAYRETTPLSYLTDLCACQELTNLRVLYLHGLPFDDIAAWMLLDSRYLKGLNTLALPAGNMSESVRSAFHARFGPKCLR